MKKFTYIFLMILLGCGIIKSQVNFPPPLIVGAALSGACGPPGRIGIDVVNHHEYFCDGTWHQADGSGVLSNIAAYNFLANNTSGSAAPIATPFFGGAIVKTTNYTALASDYGKLIIMNCAGACALTLPNPPPFATWYTRASTIGVTNATISLNSLTFNGSSIVPVINSFRDIDFYTDGTNYFGRAPFAAGTGITFTGAADKVIIALDNASTITTSWYVAAGGTHDAQTVTLSPAVTSLVAGLVVNFLPVAANTGTTPTLAVNGLAAKTITKCGTTALVANDLITTAPASVIYDGTEFVLQNPMAAFCGSSSVQSTVTIATAVQSAAFRQGNALSDTTFVGGQPTSSAAGVVVGAAYLQGGDETGATGANAGGMAILRGGLTTSTSGVPGATNIGQGFFKGAGTSTLWNLQCMTSTAYTVNDCGTTAIYPVAVATNVVTPLMGLIEGEAPINSDNATTIGHTFCTSTSAGGQGHDSGGAAACTNGQAVGVIVANSGTIVIGTGATKSTVTLGSTLPLILLRIE